MDALPVFSQTKSLIQFACGQKAEAKQTQINFSRQCPVVSQVRSAVEGIKGDKKAARETQKQCGRFVLGLVDGLPGAGHIKGGIHYALGDTEAGDAALKAASHTSGVMAAGAVGFLICGPPGAIVLGITGGAAMDATITAVDTQIKGKLQPYGFVEPLADPKNAGKWCDAVAGIVFDGLTGHATGALVGQVQAKVTRSSATSATKAAVSPLEDDVFPRVIRKGAGSCASAGAGNLAMKLKEGSVYLLQNGRLKKFKDILTRVINKNTNTKDSVDFADGTNQAFTTTDSVDFADASSRVTLTNASQFYDGDFSIKVSGSVLEVYENDILQFSIKDNKVFFHDVSGHDVGLEEHPAYKSSGEDKKVQDAKKQNCIEKGIEEQDEWVPTVSRYTKYNQEVIKEQDEWVPTVSRYTKYNQEVIKEQDEWVPTMSRYTKQDKTTEEIIKELDECMLTVSRFTEYNQEVIKDLNEWVPTMSRYTKQDKTTEEIIKELDECMLTVSRFTEYDTYTEKVNNEQDECVLRVSRYTECVYLSRRSYILDVEEEEEEGEVVDLKRREEVRQNQAMEHPRLVRTHAIGWSRKRWGQYLG